MITLFETKKTAFMLAFAAHAAFFVLMDPDYYLHLMAGKYIVEHHSLPAVVSEHTTGARPAEGLPGKES